MNQQIDRISNYMKKVTNEKIYYIRKEHLFLIINQLLMNNSFQLNAKEKQIRKSFNSTNCSFHSLSVSSKIFFSQDFNDWQTLFLYMHRIEKKFFFGWFFFHR